MQNDFENCPHLLHQQGHCFVLVSQQLRNIFKYIVNWNDQSSYWNKLYIAIKPFLIHHNWVCHSSLIKTTLPYAHLKEFYYLKEKKLAFSSYTVYELMRYMSMAELSEADNVDIYFYNCTVNCH